MVQISVNAWGRAVAALTLATATASTHARPPVVFGQTWEPNTALSDEFDGSELNQQKWRNRHAWFMGKAPGLFKPDNVVVTNGNLELRTTPLDERFRSRWMASPSISSLRPIAGLGYYEARIKAAPSSLDSAFFLQIKSGQEIDISENYGLSVNHPDMQYQARSNTHWQNKRHTHLIGTIISPNTNWHVYGAWYKSPKEVQIYVDGRYVGSHNLQGDFTKSMYMIFDVEPSKEQGIPDVAALLANPRAYVMQVDWVRSWVLAKKR